MWEQFWKCLFWESNFGNAFFDNVFLRENVFFREQFWKCISWGCNHFGNIFFMEQSWGSNFQNVFFEGVILINTKVCCWLWWLPVEMIADVNGCWLGWLYFFNNYNGSLLWSALSLLCFFTKPSISLRKDCVGNTWWPMEWHSILQVTQVLQNERRGTKCVLIAFRKKGELKN